jgi:hypothetical protein
MAKAVAAESGANFYSSSAPAFVEMFAGPHRQEVAREMRHHGVPGLVIREDALLLTR